MLEIKEKDIVIVQTENGIQDALVLAVDGENARIQFNGDNEEVIVPSKTCIRNNRAYYTHFESSDCGRKTVLRIKPVIKKTIMK